MSICLNLQHYIYTMPLCILLYKTAKTLRELVKAELFSPQKISLNHLKITLYIIILKTKNKY